MTPITSSLLTFQPEGLKASEAPVLKLPGWYIFLMRMSTYLKTGFILHVFFIISILLMLFCLKRSHTAGGMESVWYALLSLVLFSWGISTQLDAYSRYQNYKMVKDLLYQYGFRPLLVRHFSRSRCQRDAVLEASSQLAIRRPVARYFYDLGYRWYHILPSILIDKPLLLFTREYWQSTLFVPPYESKFFIW